VEITEDQIVNMLDAAVQEKTSGNEMRVSVLAK
jgi:hypothetical protein